MSDTQQYRSLVVGDIHGALLALRQVIDRSGVQKDDRLIFLGDYVDGWSQSAQVIDYLLALQQTHTCIFIKGNHDAWCESWLDGEMPDRDWLMHGGKATIKSYEGYSPVQRNKHLAFFNRMHNYYIDEVNRLYIHAGFSSMHGPDKEHYESNYSWDRTLWEMALTVDNRIQRDSKLYPKRLLLFPEIFIGHTPTVNYDMYTPMHACNVWNVDTGAAFDGKLSVMNVSTKEFWQSDTVMELYPGEKGRNK